ncbi:hypothetical protein ES703_45268 [subsurface metagenome]
MRLTKKKAIEISIALWTWLAKTGEPLKVRWAGWDKYGYMPAECSLCEYSERKADRANGDKDVCCYCPYYKMFGYCTDVKDPITPYDSWDMAETEQERKKYAGLFLEQLKQL